MIVPLWVLAANVAQAEAPKAFLTLERSRITVGEVTVIHVNVAHPQGAVQPPDLQLPEGLEAVFQGTRHETSWVNGVSVSRVAFDYVVTALAPGEYQVGPITIGGATTEVEKLGVDPAPEAAVTLSRAMVRFEPGTVWQGQVVTLVARVEARGQIYAGPDWSFDAGDLDALGLEVPKDSPTPPGRTGTIEQDGGSWTVVELIFPRVATRVGELVLPAKTSRQKVLNGKTRRDVFGRTVSEVEATVSIAEPAPLVVQARPPEPQGFSGLVGTFRFESSLDRKALKVGQSATWRVNVVGDGVLNRFELPQAEVGGAAKVYRGSGGHQVGITDDGKLITEGSWTQAIVPTQAGTLDPPAIVVWTFDPVGGVYVQHELDIPPIEVAPGRDGSGTVTSFGVSDPSVVPEDQDPFDMRPAWTSGGMASWSLAPWLALLAGLVAVPGGSVLALDGAQAAWRRFQARPVALKAPDPLQPLRSLPEEAVGRAGAFDQALRTALALKVGVAVTALDRDGALMTLGEGLRDELVAAFKVIDRVRYGGTEVQLPEKAAVEALVRAIGKKP